MEKGRLETFVDGVLAIAITLLVLDLRVPAADESLGSALLRQWPAFLAYATSFLSIGIIWVNHHRIFALIEHTTAGFLMINVLFLLVVGFLPYPTAVVAEHLQSPDQAVALLLYGGTMVLVALMFNAMWEYARRRRLLRPDLDALALRPASRSYRLGPLVYVAITAVALVAPTLGLALFALTAVYWLLPGSTPTA